VDIEIGGAARDLAHIGKIGVARVPARTCVEIGKEVVDASGDGATALDVRLVDHQHVGAHFGCGKGGVEAGSAAANDHDIGFDAMHFATMDRRHAGTSESTLVGSRAPRGEGAAIVNVGSRCRSYLDQYQEGYDRIGRRHGAQSGRYFSRIAAGVRE